MIIYMLTMAADRAVEQRSITLFLAVGFIRPHVPFYVPENGSGTFLDK